MKSDAMPARANNPTRSPATKARAVRIGATLAGLFLLAATAIYWLKPSLLNPTPPILPADLAALDAPSRERLQEAAANALATPPEAEAWGQLGLLLQNHGFAQEALAAFARAIAINPKEPRWYYLQFRLLLPRNDAGALDALRQCVALRRQSPDAPQLILAELEMERGHHDRATALYQELLGQAPEHPLAHLGLARIALLQDQLQPALRWLQPCLTNDYVARRAYQVLASIQARLGNTQGAAMASRVAGSLPQDRPWANPYEQQAQQHWSGKRAWIEQCQALLSQGRIAEALPVAQQLTLEHPQTSEGWLYIGRIHLVQNQYQEAQKALERHLALEPDSVDGHLQVGLMLMRQQQMEQAADRFRKVLQLKPDSEGAHFNLGTCLWRLKRLPEAQQSFRQAIACKPSFVEAYLSLAQILALSNQHDEALEQLALALQINPMDLRVQERLESLQSKPKLE